MSIFTEDGQTTDTTQDQAEAQQGETQASFLAQLVEAKGENWKDPEVLAKGKLESDKYIQELERQIAELKEDVTKEDYAAKILQEIRDKATASNTVNQSLPNDNNVGTKEEGTPQPTLSEEDLKSLVEKTLLEREAKATVDQNLSTVEKELEAKFGTEAGSVVKAKAEELGIGLAKLEEIAKESPTAFFALIGEKRQPTSTMLSGTVRTEGANFTQSTERDWSYYQKLRRENKKLYYTPKVQRQLMEDKARLGDKFGL
jgi:hypothetical protein